MEELRRRQRQQGQPSSGQGEATQGSMETRETQETTSGSSMVQDEITGQMRPSNAQGPVQVMYYQSICSRVDKIFPEAHG